jgi:predicted GTPase
MQVDTAGWLQRTKQEKGASSLSIMQSRKNLMRAHVVALVLDAEEVCVIPLCCSFRIFCHSVMNM